MYSMSSYACTQEPPSLLTTWTLVSQSLQSRARRESLPVVSYQARRPVGCPRDRRDIALLGYKLETSDRDRSIE